MAYLNEFDATLQLIQGKWKVMILYALHEERIIRFNALKRHIEDVSNKTLTNQLRELEEDDLISREIFPTVPPKVEYQLTEKGKTLIPVLDAICDWGSVNTNPDTIQRILCDD